MGRITVLGLVLLVVAAVGGGCAGAPPPAAKTNIAREARLALTTEIRIRQYEVGGAGSGFVPKATVSDPPTIARFVAALDQDVAVSRLTPA